MLNLGGMLAADQPTEAIEHYEAAGYVAIPNYRGAQATRGAAEFGGT